MFLFKKPVQLIDLTQTLHPDIPTWDGGCGFRSHTELDYSDGCLVKRYDCVAGVGTHMDAPSHFFSEGKDIASLATQDLVAPAAVIHLSEKIHSNYFLSVQDILNDEKEHGKIQKGNFVFVSTGWDQYWNEPERYRNDLHFPGISSDAAELLLEREIIGIGIDTLSPDGSNVAFPVHHLLLGSGKTIIENLTSLDRLPMRGAHIFALPSKVKGGAEAPVRVIGVVPLEH